MGAVWVNECPSLALAPQSTRPREALLHAHGALDTTLALPSTRLGHSLEGRGAYLTSFEKVRLLHTVGYLRGFVY